MVKENRGNVAVKAETGGSLKPDKQVLAVAERIMAESTNVAVLPGINGPIKVMYRADLITLVKEMLRAEFGDVITNRMVDRFFELFQKGLLAFIQLGGEVRLIRFGTFAAEARGARHTSRFGEKTVVQQSQMLKFDPGNEAAEIAAEAVNATPIGNLRRLMQGKAIAPKAKALLEGKEEVVEDTPAGGTETAEV